MEIPQDILDKINDLAEDASCSYETAKHYLEKGYSLASPKQDEQEQLKKHLLDFAAYFNCIPDIRIKETTIDEYLIHHNQKPH